MATRFVRIDLSDDARDFRPVAIEPGVPLLDRSNSNARIVFRWLGGMVAEPEWEWEGDSVNFYVRDDQGGRLEETVCQTATREDLEGILKQDLAAVRERIEKAKIETPTERALRKALLRSFQELIDDPHRTDLDNYFFRYRDVNGQWRLVWCWGYQRVDQEPAPAVVCTDPECGLLFVRRAKQSPRCPSCAAALAQRPKRRWRLKPVALLALLLLLVTGAAYYWITHPQRLIAEPEQWAGPVGSRIEFRITKAGLFRGEDATHKAVAMVLDPQIARLDSSGSAALALNRGATKVRFHLGDLKPIDVLLVVGEATNPDKLVLEPGVVELGIGTTARLKLIGHYKDGNKVDLSIAAEWSAQNDGIVFSYNGLLEGLAKGNTTVTARYRANPNLDYLEASAAVSVAKIDFQSLEMAIEPKAVPIGRTSQLHIDAISDEGKKYSVLESSLLKADVSPSYVATVQGYKLKGEHIGEGKLAVTFNDKHTAGSDFEVVAGAGIDRLVVQPEKLNMVVGEIADLSILSPSSAPVRVTSSKPAIAEVTSTNRLIGRREGSAEVEVTQGSEKQTVDVTVTAADFQSIAIEPGRVVVPVDDSVGPKVFAKTGSGDEERNVEIAPDLVAAEKTPSPRYASFDPRLLQLHGVRPTDPSSPQSLALRFGKHGASAPVEVVVAPFRLVLSPSGPIDLPLGQQMRLQGWANYSGGRRVQVLPERMKWESTPDPKAVPGLELRGHKVAAMKAGAGPLPVGASYFGRKSNEVVFRSVEAGPVTLRLEVDRALRLAGETAAAVLAASGPNGDVELVPELAKFTSSAEDVLKIEEKSGEFRAAAPGEAVVSASHAAAKEPTRRKLRVYDPAKARLVFDPESVRVAVNEVAKLQLYLEVNDGGKPEREALVGPGVGYSMAQPDAIRWYPPTLIGLRPASPFELSASYHPHLTSTATAHVEVLAPAEPDSIRIVPSTASLAPGQTITLRVEQQLSGTTDQWKEVRPDAIAWVGTSGLIWAPASEDLRPAATVPQGAKGEFELRANYAGRQAVAVISVKPDALDPNAADSRLVLVREPGGEFLPVGHQQRYAIMIEKDGVQEPAANVQWPDNFENEYVRWQAPVLTAKQGGYAQWLRAQAGDRAVLFHTSTYQPGRFETPPPRGDVPVAVKIISDQGKLVRMPVGAEFHDFRVEAIYAEGFTRLVTKKATLKTPEPPASAPLTASRGRLVGVRAGKTRVTAEFEGVVSTIPLEVEVTGKVDIDQIRIVPAPVSMRPGETLAVDAEGVKNGKSVGIITSLGGVAWKSGSTDIVQVNGPSLTALKLGAGSVTASLGSITSQPAAVNVVTSVGDALATDPNTVRLRVGEGARVGTDVVVTRGETDVSRQCGVTPALPSVVQYIPETRSLVGVSPGTSPVTVTFGDRSTIFKVEVQVGFNLREFANGAVVVEPASGSLAPGQALPLRVFVLGPNGERLDRTHSAVLSSSDPAKVSIQGSLACAVGPGVAQVTATLPETQHSGTAQITVGNDEISELWLDPPRLDMSVGERTRLRILGRAASGAFELFPQRDLVLTAAGANPAAIRIAGADVDAVAVGEAAVAVNWRGRISQAVPVSVADNPWTDLRIQPAQATIHPGQGLVYEVTGMRGGRRQSLTAKDGLVLFPGDQNVAQVLRGLTVGACNPGQTTVVAQVGTQRAEAGLTVTPGNLAAVPETRVISGGGVEIGPRYFERYGWVYRPGVGWVRGGGDTAVERPVLLGNAAGLRFVPDVIRMAPNSPPTLARVVEVLADGSVGRDVTADQNLELTQPPGVVTVDKTAAGHVLRPVAQGQTRVGAKLGTLTADPLLVSVGDQLVGAARLEVAPDPLVIWSGEMGSFGTVKLNPGGGQLPIEVDYKITPAPNQDIVAAAGDKMVQGRSEGATQVVITAIDPAGVYNGLSASATVQVTKADQIRIQPDKISLQVGQTTPPMAVIAQAFGGPPYQVPAALEPMDGSVLAPDPQFPGRFIAKALGQTQVRAVYRGREAIASVEVSGKRFLDVRPVLNTEGQQDFDLSITVLAAGTEGPLEYRVYVAGQPPAETWVPAQAQGDNRTATLRSPLIAKGAFGTRYQLILEARDSAGGQVQRYPLTFQLVTQVKEDKPVLTPNTTTPF